MAEPIQFPAKSQAATDLVKAIKDTVYSFSGRISVAEALGCVQIALLDLNEEIRSSTRA